MIRVLTRNDAGFTKMEILLTIAIVLIFGSILAVSFNAANNNAARTNKVLITAQSINKIDRLIREKIDNLQIPYWENPYPYIENAIQEMYRAHYGQKLKSVQILYNKDKKPAGLEVVYIVNNTEQKTIVKFPFAVLAGEK